MRWRIRSRSCSRRTERFSESGTRSIIDNRWTTSRLVGDASGSPEGVVGLLAEPPLRLVDGGAVEEALVLEAALVAVHHHEHTGEPVGDGAVVAVAPQESEGQ